MAARQPLVVLSLAVLGACGLPVAGAQEPPPANRAAAVAVETTTTGVVPPGTEPPPTSSTLAPGSTDPFTSSTVQPPDTTSPPSTDPPATDPPPNDPPPTEPPATDPPPTTQPPTTDPPPTTEPPTTDPPETTTTVEVTTTVDHAPLDRSADAGAGAARGIDGGPRKVREGPTMPEFDPAAVARAELEHLTYDVAVERNRIDATRRHHPVPEVDRWYWLVVDTGLPDIDKWMYRICRESMGDPRAWNRRDPSGGSVGLLQLNLGNRAFLGKVGVLSSPRLSRREAADELMDPATNLRAALALYDAGGERGWITSSRKASCAPPDGLYW